MLNPVTSERVFRVGHLFCGIGAGAKGFNDANPRVGNVSARFECAGGVDVDAGAIRNFNRITGTPGTVLDLFSREQYVAFHGHEPPADWFEAMPTDIRRAHGDQPLDVMFLSAPCKGFSGLLSTKASATMRYQALNQLTVRGVWLTLEAFKDGPTGIILFENVPRIETRGRALLDEIETLLRAYGYMIAETKHDCGEIGNLAQSRKRFLLVARHPAKVPPFLYQPAKSKLRGVGEVIGLLPLPGDPIGGSMHRVPALQWKTWVRLAFVPAGKDWRALNDLAIENGMLRDFGILPDLRDNQLGVLGWDDTAPCITAARSPQQGRFSVADPRVEDMHNDSLGIRPWNEPARVVAGTSRSYNGAHNVADPRIDGHDRSVQLGVRAWDKPAPVVTGKMFAGGGPNSVADPRHTGPAKFNHAFRIIPFEEPAKTVTGADGAKQCVADPRCEGSFGGKGKYRIEKWDEPSRAVIAGRDNGASAIADPRLTRAREERCFNPVKMPSPNDKLVARIVSLDNTWHRPFTTLELAALQSLFDPGEVFDLDGGSDQTRREWIGNAVPSAAAKGMAHTIGECLLLADLGETFTLSSREIWVSPLRLALSVDSRQNICGEQL